MRQAPRGRSRENTSQRSPSQTRTKTYDPVITRTSSIFFCSASTLATSSAASGLDLGTAAPYSMMGVMSAGGPRPEWRDRFRRCCCFSRAMPSHRDLPSSTCSSVRKSLASRTESVRRAAEERFVRSKWFLSSEGMSESWLYGIRKETESRSTRLGDRVHKSDSERMANPSCVAAGPKNDCQKQRVS